MRAAEVREDLLALRNVSELLADNPRAQDSIRVRNTYLDPLHLLQAELIGRLRENHDDQVAEALKITMAGIGHGPAPHGLINADALWGRPPVPAEPAAASPGHVPCRSAAVPDRPCRAVPWSAPAWPR